MTAVDLGAGPTHPLVWGRAVVVGGVAMATGVVSHVAAGGFLPGPVTLAVLLVGCVAASAGFLLRPASGVRLVALVVAGQTIAHTVLSATAGHQGDSRASHLLTPPDATAGTDFRDRYEQIAGTGHTPTGAALPDPSVTEWWNAQVEHFTSAGTWMVASHLVGAVVLGLFLAVGENALWRLVALVVTRRSVRLGVATLRLAAAGALYGIRLQTGLITQVEPQVNAAQLLARPVDRHRGPPFVLAA